MNRIRQLKDKYQVLYTPNMTYSPSTMELIIGNWEDETLRSFYIKDFSTLAEAQCEAFKMPDIDWYRLVRMYMDHYHILRKVIETSLRQNKFIVDFRPRLMDPEMLKNAMFDRVMNDGERFTLRYEMNDIVSFNIINPWSRVLKEIANSLQDIPELRIRERWTKGKVIHMIGYTDLGLLYEIKLWPTMLYQWTEWMYNYQDNDDFAQRSHLMYKKAMQAQEAIDTGTNVNYFIR